MATIKLTSSGKISLKDGKVSCECCNPCAGLWGLGYDTHPNEVTINELSVTPDRITKCDWVDGGNNFVQHINGSSPPMWRGGSNSTQGYKAGTFSAGPLGQYRANTDGTGSVIYTVT